MYEVDVCEEKGGSEEGDLHYDSLLCNCAMLSRSVCTLVLSSVEFGIPGSREYC